jgi:hypothetical protein
VNAAVVDPQAPARSEVFDRAFRLGLAWAEERCFSGYDPFDALASPILALGHQWLGRGFGVAVTQVLKRAPVNLRAFLLVPRAINAKGIALLTSAVARVGDERRTRDLAELLIGLRSPSWPMACWGYPFPWQSRAFFLPAGTPNVVTTSFAARGLMDAYDLTGERRFLEAAVDTTKFIETALHRTRSEDGDCLSYSPLDKSQVLNASALGGQVLIQVALRTARAELFESARELFRFILNRQRSDGSWPYGMAGHHGWIDSFHTGFLLSALSDYDAYSPHGGTKQALESGARYYRERFFGPSGEPWYFSHRRYPLDVHSAAQGVITLNRLAQLHPSHPRLAVAIGEWMLTHLLHPDGHFRYQVRRTHVVGIPYMRWSQAWALRAVAELVGSGETN